MQPIMKKVRERNNLTLRQKRNRASATLRVSFIFMSLTLLTGIIAGAV